MCPEPIQKSQSEPAQQERGATRNSVEQTTDKPALAPERDTPSRQSEAATSDISTAVERKNDTRKPERQSIERKHAVREQPQRQSATPAPPADARPSATSPEHPNDTADYELLMGALGTTNREFAKGLFEDLYHASARGDDKVDRQALFFPLAVLKGTKPKDELDAMHVAQMATINMAIIRLSGELAQVTNAAHLEVVTRAINQLARTYTAQLGATNDMGQYPDEGGVRFMFAFIKRREPRDEIEAALLAQAAATHVAVMRYANRLAHAESPQEQDIAERAYDKLTRTFVAQVAALQRYRDVTKQNVIVQHVSVGDGGQAIVGNVTRPAHGRSLTGRLPLTPAIPDGQQAPMEIIGEPRRAPVPRRRRKG